MGLPVMNSCSLPKAMNEPDSVRAPKSTSKPSAAILKRVSLADGLDGCSP
jgi:hypothetical protein